MRIDGLLLKPSKRPDIPLSNPILLQDCQGLSFISPDQSCLFLKGWMNVWARVICPALSLCFVFTCSYNGCLLPWSCWGSQRSMGGRATILSLSPWNSTRDHTAESLENARMFCFTSPRFSFWSGSFNRFTEMYSALKRDEKRWPHGYVMMNGATGATTLLSSECADFIEC